MRKMLVVMLIILVMLAAAPACLAANVPVYLEGERVATGLERNGSTYLPLRTMFETVGASVEWEEKTQTITATFTDGGVLTMKLDDHYADSQYRYKLGDIEYVNPDQPYMEQLPFISRGITYVSLRFVTETVLGYDLDWRDNAVYIEQPRIEYTQGDDKYILNMATGELWLNGSLITNKATVPGYAGYHAQHIYDFTVRRTPAGSYLLEGTGSSIGFMIYGLQWSCWVSADGSNSLSECQTSIVGYPLPTIVCSPGKVWLNGYSHNFCIDEASGQISQVDTKTWAAQVMNDDYASGDIRWTDGRQILLGDTGNYVLYDMQSQTGQDLLPLLFTPEIKAVCDSFLESVYFPDDMREAYWSSLGSLENPSPRLIFLGEENGQLNFELKCGYYDGSFRWQSFPISYALQ